MFAPAMVPAPSPALLFHTGENITRDHRMARGHATSGEASPLKFKNAGWQPALRDDLL